MKENVEEYILSEEFQKCPILDERQKLVVTERVKNKLSYKDISRKICRTSQRARDIFERSLQLIKLYLVNPSPITLIKDTLLSQRIKNALNSIDHITCIKDLDGYPYSDLIKMRNLGVESIKELQEYLSKLGFSLKYPAYENRIFEKRFNKKLFETWTNSEIVNHIFSLTKILKERQKARGVFFDEDF